MCSNIKQYVKNSFQGVVSIVLCKHCVFGDLKDGVTK